MKYISNADFSLPLNWLSFLKDHLYVLKQTGALNVDETLRLYMRIPQFISFFLLGNIWTAYIYIFGTVLFGIASFYIFARKFLKCERHLAAIAAVAFVVNPIMLGNFSKIGLVLGAVSLPLLLVLLRRYFESRHGVNLLYFLLLANLSFIHPFIFTVNMLVCACYFLAKTAQSKRRREVLKDAGVGIVIGLLFFAFAILPLASLGVNLSRNELSTSLTEEGTPSDLVKISNTKTLSESFMLTKPVFQDFQFYKPPYASIFVFCSFALLAIALSTMLYAKKNSIYLVSLGSLLILFALASVNFPIVLKVISFIVDNLPIGWMFRSPLKWQLYVVLPYSILLCHLKVPKARNARIAVLAGILCIIFLVNTPQIISIHEKLLTPKEISFFNESTQEKLQDANILIVRNKTIKETNATDQALAEELRTVEPTIGIRLTSLGYEKNYTSKFLAQASNFDYVLLYKPIPNVSMENISFSLTDTLPGGYLLYKKSSDGNDKGYKIIEASPTKFYIIVENSSSEVSIPVQYRAQWKIYDGGTPESDESILRFRDIRYIFSRPIYAPHTKSSDGTNSWDLETEDVEGVSRFGQEHVITAYFVTQAYYILGITISIITAIVVGIMILVHRRK